jgi:hypothetical protein
VVVKKLEEPTTKMLELDAKIKEAMLANEGQTEKASEHVKQMQLQKTEIQKLKESLLRKKRALETDVRKYHLHLRQFEVCRPYVKQVEENLKPGECLMYRDFVNQYTHDGKCVNLVLVVMWREEEHHELNILKIHNICTDKDSNSSDPYFVAAVMKHQLKSELFDKFHTIYCSGDHGTHFSAVQTIYNEGTFFEKYGKKFVVLFLCSYHAYNRCDSAGVEAKRILAKMTRRNQETNYSGVIADLINASAYENAVCTPFEWITRTEMVFPEPVQASGEGLRFYCEFQYEYVDADGRKCHEPGVVLCRKVPGHSILQI